MSWPPVFLKSHFCNYHMWRGDPCLVVCDWLLVYTTSADEAAHEARLPDGTSRFSCHMGWAVNANKLIMMVLHTWCCCLRGLPVHSHTTNELLLRTINLLLIQCCTNLICSACQLKKKVASSGILLTRHSDILMSGLYRSSWLLVLSNNRTYNSKIAFKLSKHYMSKVKCLIPGCLFLLPLHAFQSYVSFPFSYSRCPQI